MIYGNYLLKFSWHSRLSHFKPSFQPFPFSQRSPYLESNPTMKLSYNQLLNGHLNHRTIFFDASIFVELIKSFKLFENILLKLYLYFKLGG